MTHTGRLVFQQVCRQGSLLQTPCCLLAKVGPQLLAYYLFGQDPLEVPTELDSEPEEVDIMQRAEQNLVDYMRGLLDVFPEHFAKRLEKLFQESESAKLCVGTLCSGSDSVVDVLKARPKHVFTLLHKTVCSMHYSWQDLFKCLIPLSFANSMGATWSTSSPNSGLNILSNVSLTIP